MASLEEIQGQLEVQVGTLTAGDQVAAEFAYCDGVSFAIQVDVVHDILAAIDSVLDVGVEVAAYLFVVCKVIQGDLGEREEAGDLLWRRQGDDSEWQSIHHHFKAILFPNYTQTPVRIFQFVSILLAPVEKTVFIIS